MSIGWKDHKREIVAAILGVVIVALLGYAVATRSPFSAPIGSTDTWYVDVVRTPSGMVLDRHGNEDPACVGTIRVIEGWKLYFNIPLADWFGTSRFIFERRWHAAEWVAVYPQYASDPITEGPPATALGQAIKSAPRSSTDVPKGALRSAAAGVPETDGPHYPGFALLLALVLLPVEVVLAIIVVFSAAGRRRARKRVAAGLCPSCAYDRRSLAVDAKCPECGRVAIK
jgi:hypothetical protein